MGSELLVNSTQSSKGKWLVSGIKPAKDIAANLYGGWDYLLFCKKSSPKKPTHQVSQKGQVLGPQRIRQQENSPSYCISEIPTIQRGIRRSKLASEKHLTEMVNLHPFPSS